MPLIPRWRFMTDEAKALTKRTVVSAGVVVVVLLLFRALLPWLLLALAAYWIWKGVSKQSSKAAAATKKADLSRTAR